MKTLTEKVYLSVFENDNLENAKTWEDFSNLFLNIVSLTESERVVVKAENFDFTDTAMRIFDFLDKKYNLLEKLDNLVDFKKIFGGLIGGIVEKYDQNALRAIVRYIIIPIFMNLLKNSLEGEELEVH